jgi:hypothetical protein
MAGSSIAEPAAAKEEEGRMAAEPALALVTKERVPEAYITRIKTRPLRKMRPLRDSIGAGNPEARERFLATNAHIDYLVDLEQDCLRQHAERGYAEIGVDYTDGFKKIFILPQPQTQDRTPSDDVAAAG